MDLSTKRLLALAGGAVAVATVVVGVRLLTGRDSGGGPATATAPAAQPAPPSSPAQALPGNGGAGNSETPPAVTYDPTKLLENGVSAAEVYDKEPRTGLWADYVETFIGGAMGRDLEAMLPAAGVAIRCKTLSCLVGVDAPTEQRETAVKVTKFLTLAPWVVDLEPEEDGTQRWMFFQEPRFSDPKEFTSWYENLRKRTLADVRAGRKPNPFPVAPSKVPDK